MVMSWLYAGILAVSLLFASLTGNMSGLSAAIPAGAQAGINLAIAISGSICLWSGIGKAMEKGGITAFLAKILSPLLYRVFPTARHDSEAAGALASNVCANLLGLGNAATPMGILAAKHLANPRQKGIATDEMCRLIVLNTASIQLIPTNVAAVRASLGCGSPFDILPAVWITSLCAAVCGVTAAWICGKVSGL